MDTGEVVGYEVAPDSRAWCRVQWLGSDTVETLPADELREVRNA